MCVYIDGKLAGEEEDAYGEEEEDAWSEEGSLRRERERSKLIWAVL